MVSTKLSELGIGQRAINTQRYGLVNYLPYMYQDSVILMSAQPIPIVTYDSIVYPFDLPVWGFTFACIFAQLIMLQAMQYLYCKASGTPNNREYLYGGNCYDSINNKYMKIICCSRYFHCHGTSPKEKAKKMD